MPQHLVIDSVPFAMQRCFLDGEIEMMQLPRLASELCALDYNVVQYSLRGDCGDHGEPLLFLKLRGELELRCQRCLQPLRYSLDVDAVFELRDGLDDDVLLQEDLEDDSRDYLPASRSLNLVSLFEDEALLALPAVPRHAQCATPEARNNPEAASPFGVLLSMQGQSGKTH